jgi:hypothetical protein
MLIYMKTVALIGEEISMEECHLLSGAYKHAMKPKRIAWRYIYSIE